MTLRHAAAFGTFALLFGAVGPAYAQDPGGMSSELERTATTTPAEKVAYAEAANIEISDAVSTITTLLDNAKKSGDVEALQGLTSRLASGRALQQVSQDAETAMKSAIAKGETERANHEFRKIAVAVSKVRALLAEAQQLTTDQAAADGITNVTFFVEEEVDIGDDDGNDIDDLDIGFDPPDSSPF